MFGLKSLNARIFVACFVSSLSVVLLAASTWLSDHNVSQMKFYIVEHESKKHLFRSSQSADQFAYSTKHRYISRLDGLNSAAGLALDLDGDKSSGTESGLTDQTETPSDIEFPPLFTTAEEGLLRQQVSDKLGGIDNPEFKMFRKEFNPQSLVFLKLHKVGGTSIALALMNATKYYRLHEGPTKKGVAECDQKKFQIYYAHATRGEWMEKCLPNHAIVTIFREATSQYVSKMTWAKNRKYFINYPDRECDYTKGDRKPKGDGKDLCSDDLSRHNETLKMFLARVKGLPNSSSPCGETCSSVTMSATQDTAATITELKRDYALYATTEHLDEFLVLIALRFGWSLDTMIYEKCKEEGNVKVSPKHLVGEHAWALDKIKVCSKNQDVIYKHARDMFEAYIARLGPEFTELVNIFKARVKSFQDNIKASRTNKLKWRYHPKVLMC